MIISSKVLYNSLAVDLQPYQDGFGTAAQKTAADMLMKNVLKKFRDDIDLKHTQSAAIEKFCAMNLRCAEWKYLPEDYFEEMLIGAFNLRLWSFFNHESFNYDLGSYAHAGYFGPGASVNARGQDFFTKAFDSPLSSTSEGIYRAYSNYVLSIPSWRAGEIVRACLHGDADIVQGSSLSCVPKTNAIARTICTEPSLNMFFQLGYGKAILDRLNNLYRIDLSTQPQINASLAQKGSINGSLFTLDLESASDTISLRMLERFMPKTALSMLKGLRSSRTRLPGGEWLDLNMVSSMGNGFTFPLQTTIFTCALFACADVIGVNLQRNGNPVSANFGVFGDDIVGPKALYAPLCRLLKLLGFLVNKEKSFVEGPFRESCGADFYRGQNVRSVYIKSLKTQGARYVAINRLNEWSAENGIPLIEAISYLLKGVSFLPVPLHEADDAGVRMPLSLVRNRLRLDSDTFCFMYYKNVSRPKFLSIQELCVRVPKKDRYRAFNGPGLITAFLGGYITANKITIRSTDGSIRSGTSKCVTSRWDFIPIRERHLGDPVLTQGFNRRLVISIVQNSCLWLR